MAQSMPEVCSRIVTQGNSANIDVGQIRSQKFACVAPCARTIENMPSRRKPGGSGPRRVADKRPLPAQHATKLGRTLASLPFDKPVSIAWTGGAKNTEANFLLLEPIQPCMRDRDAVSRLVGS